jgi:single-strand DNA-binding protein
MSLPTITGEFGIVADPELKFADGGRSWIKIRGVAKDRKRGTNGEWEDGDPCYMDIIIGGKIAENTMESVGKGDNIVVTGTLKQREWVSDDGKTQKAYSIQASSIGVSTRFNAAVSSKTSSGGSAAPVVSSFSEEAPF